MVVFGPMFTSETKMARMSGLEKMSYAELSETPRSGRSPDRRKQTSERSALRQSGRSGPR